MKISSYQLNKLIEEEINLVLFEDKKSCRGSAIHSTTGRFVNKNRARGSYAIEDIPADCDRQRTQATRTKGSAKAGKPRSPCGRKDSSRNRKCRGIKEQDDSAEPTTAPLELPQPSLGRDTPVQTGLRPSTGLQGRLNNMRSTVEKLGLTVDELHSLFNIAGEVIADELDKRRV